MLISIRIKEILILLKSNRDLIHTIQRILQIFPEGVIIRSLDETSKQTILKFANYIASKDLDWEENQESKVIVIDNQNLSKEDKFTPSISLNEFLDNQESKFEFGEPHYMDQMIWIK